MGKGMERQARRKKQVSSIIKQKKTDGVDKTPDQILISASFTASPVSNAVEFWRERLGFDFKTGFLSYNQIFQELLNPDSLFRSNRSGMNVILLRIEDWLPYNGEGSSRYAEMVAISSELMKLKQEMFSTLNDFITALQTFNVNAPCQTLLIICPLSEKFRNNDYWNGCFSEIENALVEKAKGIELIHVLRAEEFHSPYQVAEVDDPERNEIGHIPFVDDYYLFLGTLIVRYYHWLTVKSYKVIVLDCDNTLWNGVCGETGPDGVKLSSSFKFLQRFLVKLKEQGMLLCICSKNSEEDVWAVFDNRTDFPLKRDFITDYRINWLPKSQNIKSLAESLNLSLDSFIFIDDNPVECAEVQANCPEVLTLQWPESKKDRQGFIQHTWAFDHFAVTAEDAQRTLMTKQNLQRQLFLKQSTDFESFLKSLNLEIDILPAESKHLSRASQLTKRTNQFNLTTIRRGQSEIQRLVDNEGYECRIVEVKDRFGEYGLVGLLIFKQSEGLVELDSFLLSCRVLGRGVEHAMLAEVAKIAFNRGCAHIGVLFVKTEKNSPALNFIESVVLKYPEFSEVSRTESSNRYLFDSEKVKDISFIPSSPRVTEAVGLRDEGLKAKRKEGLQESGLKLPEQKIIEYAGALTSIRSISKAFKETSVKAEDGKGTVMGDSSIGRKEYFNVLEQVKKIFGKILSIDAGKINTEDNLENYVNESLKIVELTAELKRKYRNIPSTLLFEASSLDEIARKICSGFIREERPLTVANFEMDEDRPFEIAIIGVSGRFPRSGNMEEFWQNLLKGTSCISEVPRNRWDNARYFDPSGRTEGKSHSKWGGFIDDVDCFDSSFFNISPKEAELMDPQQRIFMEVIWRLLEDACYTRRSLAHDTGVFVGVISNDYNIYLSESALLGLSAYRGAEMYQIPNRISYFLDLHGPSIAIDTACSASGTAVHLACESIKRGECSSAIVGGVNLFLHPSRYIQYSKMQMLSKDNKCCPFGAEAAGAIFGEGIGALLLKPLSRAKEDGDNIYAVIKGTSVNSGGKTNGFTVPNPNAQGDMIAKALDKAQIPSRTISYIEAHGTGTPLGDPIEVRGLTDAFSRSSFSDYHKSDTGYCALGSIKSNIGHLESGAAVAGIIKTALQMRFKTIVPSLNSEALNPMIPFETTPFYVVQEPKEWKKPVLKDEEGREHTFPRRAGVSSFGAGGSNVHVVLEEYEEPDKGRLKGNFIPVIILSAKSEEALKKMAGNLKSFIEKCVPVDDILGRIAYNLQTGREQLKFRLAILCDSVDELKKRLEEYLEGGYGSEKIMTGVVQNNITQFLSFGKTGFDLSFLNELCKANDFSRIASLWIAGADFYWECLYKKGRPRRMSLPTYPFARERHWILKPSLNHLAALNGGSGVVEGFSPLLHGIDALETIKTDSAIVFNTLITPEHSSVSGHIIRKEHVLSAATFIEMVRAAVIQVEGNVPVEIDFINFLHPLIVKDKVSIKFELRLKGQKEYDFEIRCPGREPDLYCKGSVRACCEQEELFINVQELQTSSVRMSDAKEFYEKLSKLGMDYSGLFCSLRKLWSNGEEILGEIQLDYSQIDSKYGCNPGVVDSILQSRFGIGSGRNNANRVSSMKSIRINEDLPLQGFSYMKQADGASFYQAAMIAPSGKVIMNVQQMSVENERNPGNELMYVPVWDVQPATALVNGRRIKTVLIVFAESEFNLERTVEDYYIKNGITENVIKIKLGDETKQVSEKEWICGIDDMEGFRKCLEKYGVIDCIYFISDFRSENKTVKPECIVQSQQRNEIQLLRLIKLMRQSESSKECVDCYVITQDNYRVSDAEINPFGGGVTGLTYAVAHSEYRFAVRNIDVSIEDLVSNENQEQLMIKIAAEEPSSRGDLIKLTAERRYKQSFVRLDAENFNKTAGLKKGGVYIVLGGSGTVGGIITRYLIKEYQAKVIWIGRKAGTSDFVKERLAALDAVGEQPHYIQADATSSEQMNAAVEEIKSLYPSINGAIFLGVVISFENSISKTDEKEFLDIVNIKSEGSMNFYNAFKDEDLDFICYFSSGQAFSFSGAANLSAYAAGITFADSYVKLVREGAKYPVGIINWGFWKASVADSLKSRNIGSLDDREGFGCFENFVSLLRRGFLNQVVCLKASKPVLELMKCKDECFTISDKCAVPLSTNLWSNGVVREYDLKELLRISNPEELKECMVSLLFQQLFSMGYLQKGAVARDCETLRREAGILEKHGRLLEECLNILEMRGYIKREGKGVKVTDSPEREDWDRAWQTWEPVKETYLKDADWSTRVRLLDACMRQFPDILRGKVPATDIIFPGSSMKMLEGVYKGNVLSDYFNTAVADIVAEYVKQRVQEDPDAKVRIIEAGAGTGGTSAMVFSRLKSYQANVEYCYTDISKAFLLFAKERYSGENSFIKYKLFNVEKQIGLQGIEAGSYDIAISTNCLHATKNINKTLRNVKAALKTNGFLLLNEETEKTIFTTLTFGLLDGWWLYEDEKLRIPGAPLLYAYKWEKVLKEEGFSRVHFPVAEASVLGQQVIVAESNGIIRQDAISRPVSTDIGEVSISVQTAQVKKEHKVPAVMRDVVQPHPGQSVKQLTPVASGVREVSADKFLKETLLGELASSLKIPPDSINSTEAFSEYGVDSIIGISFVNRVSDVFEIQLNSAILFDYPTLDRLAGYILKTYKEQINKKVLAVQGNMPSKSSEKGLNGLFAAEKIPEGVTHSNEPEMVDNDKVFELLEKNFFEDKISIDSLIRIIKE